MIKKFLPKTLLGRSTLILLIPLIGLQIIVTLIFYNRHWDTITRHRTINFAGDIALLVESFEKFDSLENQKWVLNNASSKLQLASKDIHNCTNKGYFFGPYNILQLLHLFIVSFW